MSSRDELWSEKRNAATVVREIHAASLGAEKSRPMTAEEEGRYNEAADTIERIERQMAQEDRHASLEKRLTDPTRTRDLSDPEAGGDEAARTGLRSKAYKRAFDRFMRYGDRRLDEEDRNALRAGFDDGVVESRTLSALTGAAGGYLVTPTFQNQIIETQKYFGGVLQAGVEILNTSGGEDIYYPTNDDTANVGELLAENGSVSLLDVSFGQRKLSAYMASSKMVKVPLQLLSDESFNLESFLGKKFGQRLGRLINQLLTTGTGAAQPLGVATGATSGLTAAGAAAITYNELIDLEHSVDPAYRNLATCKFMWADATLKAVRKLQDSQNRPLWEPSLQAGVASLLNGYQYIVNPDMPAMTTGNKSVLFGDFGEYYIARFAGGIVSFRLAELFIQNLQQAFFAIERFDGGPKNTAAVKALTQA